LPEQIDLSKVEYADTYKKVQLQTIDGKTKTGKPIVYGVTVPKNAENPEMGLEFVKFVIGTEGQTIFSDMGQPPIVPPIGSGAVPDELKDSVALEAAEPTPAPTETPAPTSVTTPTVAPTAAPTTAPTTATEVPKEPGFEAIYALAGLLAIAYLVLRRNKI